MDWWLITGKAVIFPDTVYRVGFYKYDIHTNVAEWSSGWSSDICKKSVTESAMAGERSTDAGEQKGCKNDERKGAYHFCAHFQKKGIVFLLVAGGVTNPTLAKLTNTVSASSVEAAATSASRGNDEPVVGGKLTEPRNIGNGLGGGGVKTPRPARKRNFGRYIQYGIFTRETRRVSFTAYLPIWYWRRSAFRDCPIN